MKVPYVFEISVSSLAALTSAASFEGISESEYLEQLIHANTGKQTGIERITAKVNGLLALKALVDESQGRV